MVIRAMEENKAGEGEDSVSGGLQFHRAKSGFTEKSDYLSKGLKSMREDAM